MFDMSFKASIPFNTVSLVSSLNVHVMGKHYGLCNNHDKLDMSHLYVDFHKSKARLTLF